MSLYGNFTLAAALGLAADCRNDAGGDGGAGGGSPDVGAAGGAEVSLDDSAQVSETDVPVDASAASAAVDDDDEPDLNDDAHRDKPWRDDPDFKRALNRARRAQRQLAKHRPILEKIRAFNIGDNLDDVVTRARRFDEVQPLLRRATSGETSRAAQPPQEYQPPPFDRNSVPFDPNEPGGRWIADYAEQQHNTLHQVIGVMHQMAREIHTMREGRAGEQRTREVTNWRGEIDRASKLLPEKVNGIPIRMMFSDAVIGAFHQLKVNGGRVNGRPVTPDQVIQHYLKEFSAQKKNPAALTAAAQQRIAENNRTLPGRQAFAGGTPAEARNRSTERVKDVTKRLLGGRRW